MFLWYINYIFNFIWVFKLKKKILIVAPYVSFPSESGANRFIFLAKYLKEDYIVTIVTSRFYHKGKVKRAVIPCINGVEVVLLEEPGYKRNIDIQRLLSHRKFINNFKVYLANNINQYDLVYSAYPLIKTNIILGELKKTNDFKLIIDVQDIWPEAITGAFPLLHSSIGNFLLEPLTRYANRAYSYADGLVAVSNTYLKRANINKLSDQFTRSVYIGADGVPLPSYNNSNKKIQAVYLGTLGESYDLETIIRAACLCKDKVDFVVVGTGPQEEFLKQLNNKLGGYVKFLGSLSYKEAIEVVKNSDIALNAIKTSAKQSITNKLSDYFYCNKPIVSSQTNSEVVSLLSRGGGINYNAGDHDELSKILINLKKSDLLKMSEVNRQIYKELFYRKDTYKMIVKLIESLL